MWLLRIFRVTTLLAVLLMAPSALLACKLPHLTPLPEILPTAVCENLEREWSSLRSLRKGLIARSKHFNSDCRRVPDDSAADLECRRNQKILMGELCALAPKIKNFNEEITGHQRQLQGARQNLFKAKDALRLSERNGEDPDALRRGREAVWKAYDYLRTLGWKETGLVEGMTNIYGYYVPPSGLSEEEKKHAREKLKGELRLAGAEEDLIDPAEYNFIIGVASTHELPTDLSRVAADELSEGRFSAENQALYASLRYRQFDRLDCHSNGAMVCLHALKQEDVKTRDVRLFGPQITERSLAQWQAMVEDGTIGSVRIYINQGDPVPSLAMSVGEVVGEYKNPITRSWVLGNLIGSYVEGKRLTVIGMDYFNLDYLKKSIGETSPGLGVTILDCEVKGEIEEDLKNCHSIKRYQSNLKNAKPDGGAEKSMCHKN